MLKLTIGRIARNSSVLKVTISSSVSAGRAVQDGGLVANAEDVVEMDGTWSLAEVGIVPSNGNWEREKEREREKDGEIKRERGMERGKEDGWLLLLYTWSTVC